MRRIVVPLAALALAASATCASAQTTRLNVEYSIYLTAIPIASATVVVHLTDDNFVVSGRAKTSSFIRLISKGEGTAKTQGSFEANRVKASMFSGRYITRRETKIELSVADGVARKVSIEPTPPPNAAKGRVPITNESRTNVVDPLIAAIALVPGKGDLLSPESCNRTLPIFDGRYRFNVVLTYARVEKGTVKADGYEGATLVCRARYVPIAGHRTDAETTQQMADNREMFVWLAPIAGTRVLAPIKASLASPMGNFTVQATRFETSKR
jgi:hypothetical protein